MDLLEYDIRIEKYTSAKSLNTDCIDLLLYNTGTAIAYLDTLPINPSASFPINGNIGEIIKAYQHTITFDSVGTPELFVVRRFYTNAGDK